MVYSKSFNVRRETPDFISPDQWSPNSPDMNPVDYKIWAVMQQRIYEKRVNDVDEVCERLLSVWHSIGHWNEKPGHVMMAWRRTSPTVLLMRFLWLYNDDAALQTIYRALIVIKL